MKDYKYVDVVTRSVWEDNLEEEMSIINKQVVTNHRIVSLTTHFPSGADRLPPGIFWGNAADNYSALLQTTHRMETQKMLQVGLAFSDQEGKLPCCGENGRPCVWEFNLTPRKEAADRQGEEGRPNGTGGGAGAKKGIRHWRLASCFYRCNLLLNEKFTWVVFKGGLDFVALLRWVRLSVQPLPPEVDGFLRLQRLYFPVCYDMAATWGFHPVLGDDGTIHVLGRSLCVPTEELPPSRPAADSLLALRLFATLKRLLTGTYMLTNRKNVIFGITLGENADSALAIFSYINMKWA
ncbi:unnamed protein product [Victoria cruziana]